MNAWRTGSALEDEPAIPRAGGDGDPCALVTAVGARFETEARRRGITLAAAVGADVPHRVRLDGVRLSRALSALVASALHATTRGAIVLELATAASRTGGRRLVASVTSGGLPTRTDPDLALCRRLVRRLGSRLALAPREPAGWTLSFAFELRRGPGAGSPAVVAGTHRVLLLAPGGPLRERLRAPLCDGGACVDAYADPGSALAALRLADRSGSPFRTMIVAAEPGEPEAALALGARLAGGVPAGLELVLCEPAADAALRERAVRAGYRHVVAAADALFDLVVGARTAHLG